MSEPWLCSLHGGHSGQFCDHAGGTLREVVEAAIARGFSSYGVSEHAPRYAENLLYAEERDMGWDVAKLVELFESYTTELFALADEYCDRIELLRGFEAEVVPSADWFDRMSILRQVGFDFVVGSVHHVAERSIDGPLSEFEEALGAVGGLENLVVAYYESLSEMVQRFRPEVVGHFDLVRKNGHRYGNVDTPRCRTAASAALEAIADSGAILDLNCAGFRKGLPTPYPAPHFVSQAHQMGIPFCFGDDSHGPEDVGRDLDRGREYLIGLGIDSVTTLTRTAEGVAHRRISL